MNIEEERRGVHDMIGQLERRVDTNDARGESDIRLISQRMQQMERHIEINDSRIDKLQKERESMFIWGILALGSIVIAIGTWAISIVMGGHIK
jgi:hypothetical protein